METQQVAVVAFAAVAGLALVAVLVMAVALAGAFRSMMSAVVAMAERKQVHRLVQEGEAVVAAAQPDAPARSARTKPPAQLWKPAPDVVVPNGQPDEAH